MIHNDDTKFLAKRDTEWQGPETLGKRVRAEFLLCKKGRLQTQRRVNRKCEGGSTANTIYCTSYYTPNFRRVPGSVDFVLGAVGAVRGFARCQFFCMSSRASLEIRYTAAISSTMMAEHGTSTTVPTNSPATQHSSEMAVPANTSGRKR